MNIQQWNEELEIYDLDNMHGDGSESIIHLWQSEKDNVVFKVGKGYELKETDDAYGNKLYVVQRKK